MELARLGPPIFFLLQFITGQIFRFFLPDQLTVRRGAAFEQQMYLPRRIAIWLGPIAALLVALLSSVIGPSLVILLDAALYVAMLYLFLLNMQSRRR